MNIETNTPPSWTQSQILRVLIRRWYLLVPVFFAHTFIDQFITSEVEALLQSTQGVGSMIWFYGAVNLINSLVFPLLAVILVLSATPESPKSNGFKFLMKSWESLTIESMRAWGKIMWRSFLLILPGIWFYWKTLLLPFVVVYSDSYQKGEQDAFEACDQLSKKAMFPLVGLWFIFEIIIPLLETSIADSWKLLTRTPWMASVLILIQIFIFVIYTLQLKKMFFQLSEKKEVSL